MPQTQKPRTKQKPKSGSHVYRGIRDPVCADASSASLVQAPLDNTYIGNAYTLCPMGISGVQWSISGSSVLGSTSTSVPPRLPFLYSTSRNFQEYRILNAVAVFVSNLGTNAVGKVTLCGSRDVADTGGATTQLAWANAKTWEMGGIANKEARYQLPIDSSWKRVSNKVWGSVGSTWVPLNSVNDLSFGTLMIATVSQSANANPPDGQIGTLYIEYDVEFRGPTSILLNN